MSTSGNNVDDESLGGARGGGHAKRSRKQPNPQHVVRSRPDTRREVVAAVQGVHDNAPPVVGTEGSGDGVTMVKEDCVYWDKRHGKWQATGKVGRLSWKAWSGLSWLAHGNYVKDGVDIVPHRSTSQFKGVIWHKPNNKWRANSKGKHLGYHATEEEAARAVDDYVEHGTVPECRTVTSRFKGVSWLKFNNKWQATCK